MVIVVFISLYSLRDLPLTDFLKYNFVFLSCVLFSHQIISFILSHLFLSGPICVFIIHLITDVTHYRSWSCLFILISKTDQNFHMEQLCPLHEIKG